MLTRWQLLYRLKEWWRIKTEAATIGTHEGVTVLQRRVCHCIWAYYDQNRVLVGFYIALSTEPERFIPTEIKSKMPLIARLRSPDISEPDEPTIAY